jgi:hypothetical protein
VNEIFQGLGRFVALEPSQQRDEVMDAAIGLLRAGFQQIEKFFVVSKELAD